MKNRYKLLELAREHGVPVKKQLKTWVSGQLVVIEVDRPVGELADELAARGVL